MAGDHHVPKLKTPAYHDSHREPVLYQAIDRQNKLLDPVDWLSLDRVGDGHKARYLERSAFDVGADQTL
jgi:hypothetical protein